MKLKSSETKSYGGSFYYSKEAFLLVVADFQKEGFQKIEVKIPSNFEESKSSLTLEEFINLEYNFKAVILIAENTTTTDLIKVLFINHTAARKNFNDYTFPSTESEGPKFYVSSQSQIRLNGLTSFVRSTLEKHNLNKGLEYQLGKFLSLLSFFYIVGFVFLVINEPSRYFLVLSKEVKILLVIILPLAVMIPFLYYVSVRRGLYVKHFENPSLSFINQILVGNFKENPLIYTLCRLGGAVILGLLIWAVTEVLKGFLS